MTDETYEGWSNRETWAYALWIGNDEGMYNYIQDAGKQLLEQSASKAEFTQLMSQTLKDYLEELQDQILEGIYEGQCCDKQLVLMMDDIGSKWRISYQEIAESEFADEMKKKFGA